jgi:hypothetical protein
MNLKLFVIGNTTFWENMISNLSNEFENSGISCKIAFAGLVELSLVKNCPFEYQILTKTGRVICITKLGSRIS